MTFVIFVVWTCKPGITSLVVDTTLNQQSRMAGQMFQNKDLFCNISLIVLEVLIMVFAAAGSPVSLCFAALTVPNPPEPAVPLHIQSSMVKSHGDGVADMSGGGAGLERYDLKYAFRFD